MKIDRRLRPGPGFTLVEMLVVVAIVAVLSSIAFPLAELAHRRAKEEELRQALRDIRTAIDSYKRMVDTGYIVRSVDGSGYPPSLRALVDGEVNARTESAGRIYFLRSLPRDPFAPETISDPEKTWAPRSYESPPQDPRLGRDIFDVHSMSAGVGLNGRPYREW